MDQNSQRMVSLYSLVGCFWICIQ